MSEVRLYCVAALALAAVTIQASAALAQAEPRLHPVDARMHALDAAVVGYEGIAIPGLGSAGRDLPIFIINGNKPCGPQKDVWSYPDSP